MVQQVLARRPRTKVAVSCTTRPARPMEREGVSYHFISEAEFNRRRERGDFIEWAEVHGNLYGTLREEVESLLQAGNDVILEIDVQGAAQVKSRIGDVVLIFLEPPSFTVLEDRLRKRRTDDEGEILRRRAAAYDELRRKDAFDAVIVNDEIEATVQQVLQKMDEMKESK